MDRIKDCGRIADVLLIDIPSRVMAWNGNSFTDTGEILPPHLLVPTGRFGGEDGNEELDEAWPLPDEWRALLMWH